MELPQQVVNELQTEGYSQQEINQAVREIEREGRTPLQRQTSSFRFNPTDNLIKWQLELNDILERAEHILKQDIVVVEDGNVRWQPNPDQSKRIFNEYGVQEIMRVLSMYINRNTILSDYEHDEINDKVYDFGKELNDLLFMKYEDFGLTTLERRKNYPILIRELIDIVHSAYKRALYGGERDSLRTARQIAQTEQIMPQGININTGEAKKERTALNPMRYLIGRYK